MLIKPHNVRNSGGNKHIGRSERVLFWHQYGGLIPAYYCNDFQTSNILFYSSLQIVLQVVVDAGAIAHLAQMILNPDAKLKV